MRGTHRGGQRCRRPGQRHGRGRRLRDVEPDGSVPRLSKACPDDPSAEYARRTRSSVRTGAGVSTVQRASGAIHSVAAVRALVALGAVLTALSLLAGHANRHLLDGPTFAEHVDQIRTDDAVSVVLGRAISA